MWVIFTPYSDRGRDQKSLIDDRAFDPLAIRISVTSSLWNFETPLHISETEARGLKFAVHMED